MTHSVVTAALGLLLLAVWVPTKASSQNYEAGHEIEINQSSAIYNHPAGINTEGGDVFLDVSFIYWQARQGGMSLAIPFPDFGTSITTGPQGSVIYQNFDYKPGFKLEAGFRSDDFDDWGGKIEYTWLHGTHSTGANVTNAATTGAFFSYWFLGQRNTSFLGFNSKWNLEFDSFVFGLFRTYYVGKRLTLMPFYGGQWGWVRQELNFDFFLRSPVVGLPAPATVVNSSTSWFVGPRVALSTNWMLGYGVRLIGNTGVGVVYQSFKARHIESEVDNVAQGVGPSTKIAVKQMRPNFDMQIGMGWGTYAWNRKFHFDLSATYDFMMFAAQNMMRMLSDYSHPGVESQPGNLYFQGLTMKGQFNF